MNSKQKRSRKRQLIAIGFDRRCFWCGQELLENKETLDHLIPQSQGGSNAVENLRFTCYKCNSSRGNSLYPPERFG